MCTKSMPFYIDIPAGSFVEVTSVSFIKQMRRLFFIDDVIWCDTPIKLKNIDNSVICMSLLIKAIINRYG